MREPWTELRPLDDDRSYLVLASEIPARTYRATPALFKGSMAVKRQLRETPGVMGFSLLARPLAKQYASLSVWESEEALAAFAHTGRHGEAMAELAPAMAPTTFVRWTIAGSDGRPRWREALQRIATAKADRAVAGG